MDNIQRRQSRGSITNRLSKREREREREVTVWMRLVLQLDNGSAGKSTVHLLVATQYAYEQPACLCFTAHREKRLRHKHAHELREILAPTFRSTSFDVLAATPYFRGSFFSFSVSLPRPLHSFLRASAMTPEFRGWVRPSASRCLAKRCETRRARFGEIQ